MGAMGPNVVIVGGGFGGLYAARRLAASGCAVTLVDRQNYHLFQPLLYQVATAGLSPGDIASPIRYLLGRYPTVQVRLAEVEGVSLATKELVLKGAERLRYDTLILAAGVRHSYFGKQQWEAHAPGLKTLDDALDMRRRVLMAFEAAELESDEAKRQAWLTFAVVGAGPTGVELAGAVCELARFTVAKEFRRFDPRKARVLLVEGGDRVLSAFDPALSAKAKAALERLGVEVQLGKRVTDVSGEGVTVDGAFVAARTVLWAAGVEAPAFTRTLGVPLDRAGRVLVDERCQLPGHPEAFVIGDLASCRGADGQPLPGLCPVAMQQGRYVADVILARAKGREPPPFRYVDKGIMATVGRAAGIAQTGRLRISGVLGWLAWLFVHIVFLIGFRNRLLVLIQWAWAWLTYGRSARLITGLEAPKLPAG